MYTTNYKHFLSHLTSIYEQEKNHRLIVSNIPFFQVFFLTVVFGLFHGLVFFPVILSLLGPQESPVELKQASAADILKSKATGLANPGFVTEDHSSATTSGIEVRNHIE